MIGHHPHNYALAAWFDGEGSDAVGSHVARCGRCRRRVAELARVRSWLRAQPFVAMTDDTEEPPRPHHRWRPALVVALLLFAYLLVPRDDGPGTSRSPGGPLSALSGDSRQQPPAPSSTVAGGASASEESPRSAPSGGGGDATTDARRDSPQLTAARPPAWNAPVRLGLVVPTSGPLAWEGAEVRDVVQQRVLAANASGGVGGVPIELVVAAAEDRRALESMAAKVHAIVGGFGAEIATATPWLFPADPAIHGTNVVPAEGAPKAVGERLAADLRAQGLMGLVGVIVGSGPDSALATGLASGSNITTVVARRNTTCLNEIATLRRAGAMVLAVAGDSDLAASCVRAAADSPWQPRIGPLVPPSAAYAGVGSLPEATGARTVLALPWPTSSRAGAARYRATTTSLSYRALVSYAATELAIDVARQTGSLRMESMTGRVWRSDLFALEGVTNRSGTVASALLGTWVDTR